jgi:hypothetical protein
LHIFFFKKLIFLIFYTKNKIEYAIKTNKSLQHAMHIIHVKKNMQKYAIKFLNFKSLGVSQNKYILNLIFPIYFLY